MSQIKVLLIEDSAAMRNLLRSVLVHEDDVQVCGFAKNGKEGLDQIRALNPDLVILDIEMPVMNGLEVLPRLRKQWPSLPVIMFSSLTEKGTKETLEALTLGANECVGKPSGGKNLEEAIKATGQELIPKIRSLVQLASKSPMDARRAAPRLTSIRRRPTPKTTPESPKEQSHPARRRAPVAAITGEAETQRERSSHAAAFNGADVVAISASTGGPNALLVVLKSLPANLSVPIIVTQHIPTNFASKLVERFARECPINAVEVTEEMVMEPGVAYFPTGDHHLIVRRKGTAVVALPNHDEPENFCRPAADPMLRSAVDVYGGRVLSVVLTGMGSDGMKGSLLVGKRGGRVIAQDEKSSVVWGMPGAIAKANGADKVLPLEMIANEIILAARPRPVKSRK